MAGSYNHLLGDGGWRLIENMGDAHECVEELFWLVEAVIGRKQALEHLEHFYVMKRGERPKSEHLLEVERRMEVDR